MVLKANSSTVGNGYREPPRDLNPRQHHTEGSMDNRLLLLDEQQQQQSLNASSSSPDKEDPTARRRTIEFLRARLLSERSVSRAANQKAHHLAQKVLELERQLDIVIEQRKKAEEATREALAILESDGMTDYSEAFDSPSAADQDRDASSESKDVEVISNGTYPRPSSAAGEEDDTSTMGSGSEKNLHETNGHDLSKRVHRRLSWQTRGNSCGQHGSITIKNLNRAMEHKFFNRPHSGRISDAESVSKRRMGKSCRQVKRRETRAVTEVEVEQRVLTAYSEDENKKPTDPTLIEFSNSGEKGSVDQFTKVFDVMSKKDFDGGSPLGDEKVIGGDSCSQAAEKGDEIDLRADQMGEKTSEEDCGMRVHPEFIVTYSAEDQERQVDSGSDKEMEMERVLEQQAELIDQYEAEENAQTEWEKKFKELSSSSEKNMDYWKHEKQSRGEVKEQKGVYLNGLKKVNSVSITEKKECIEKYCQSTSDKSSISDTEKLVFNQALEVGNEAIHVVHVNESETCHVDKNMPSLKSNNSCGQTCSSGCSFLDKEEPIEIEQFLVKGDNLVQDVSIGNMQKHSKRNAYVEATREEEQPERTFESFGHHSVVGVECPGKENAARKCVIQSSDKVAVNVVEPFCQDSRQMMTEKPSHILEKHISSTTSANGLLAPSASVLNGKAVNAMHTMPLFPAKDTAERLSDDIQSSSKIVNTGPVTQPPKIEKQWTEGKTAIRSCEILSGGGMTCTSGDKPHISQENTVRNSVQITTDSIPTEPRAHSESSIGSYNNEKGVMQGFNKNVPMENITSGYMHAQVSMNPMKYMSVVDMRHVKEGKKKNEEYFDTSDLHNRTGMSDANLKIMSQKNVESHFCCQAGSGNMANTGDITPGTATDIVSRGGSLQTSGCDLRFSEHSDVGNSTVVNKFPENRLSMPPFQDTNNLIMNRIDPDHGSHESHVPMRDVGPIPQWTFEMDDYTFQKSNATLEMNQRSSRYIFPGNYQENSRIKFGDRLSTTTAGTAGNCSKSELESFTELGAGKNSREESCISQRHQDHLGAPDGRFQSLTHNQSSLSSDALKSLQLAKSQLQSVFSKTQSAGQCLNLAPSFKQEADKQKVIHSGSFLEAPLSCAELFRIPSEATSGPRSQNAVSRPYVADLYHGPLIRIPNSLSPSASGRERPNLHTKKNQSHNRTL